MKVFFSILASLYGGITSARNSLYDLKLLPQYKSKLPVICIGNLTVGGNGKTPLVRFLVKEMKEKGYRPVVLTRGYGGKKKGPYLVSGQETFHEVGDEALLVARDHLAPVVVARDRVAGAKLIEKQNTGDLIILDDGFQHRRLSRDLDIVCVSCSSKTEIEGFIAGKLLPLGKFREERSAGLKRAKIVMLSSRSQSSSPVDSKLLACFPSETTIYRSFVHALNVTTLDGSREIRPGKVIAFSGIANPQGFFTTLRELGFEVIQEKAFGDHHVFTEREIKSLRNEFPECDFVTTEKDAVRLVNVDAALKSKTGILRIETQVSPHDAFLVQVQREIGKSK